MKLNLYSYQQYRTYVQDWINRKPKQGYGIRREMASSVGCTSGYLTAILNGTQNLSLEQAEAMNEYMGHSTQEGNYFSLLVQRDRAGTEKLRQKLTLRIQSFLRDVFHPEVPTILIDHSDDDLESMAITDLIFSLTGSERYRTVAQLSKFLGADERRLQGLLDGLERHGTLRQDQEKKYRTVEHHSRSRKSRAADRFDLTLRRLAALQHLNEKRQDGHHGSSTMTISKTDYPKVLGILKNAHREIVDVITDSDESDARMFVLNFDFFECNSGLTLY